MKLLRLDGDGATLLLLLRDDAMPEIVHWGARLPDGVDAEEGAALRDRARPHNAMDDDFPACSLFPTGGCGLFQMPALAAHRDGRDWTADFAVTDTRSSDDELVITACDQVARLTLTIRLHLAGQTLTMRTALRNDAETPLAIHFLAAGVFAMPDAASELLVFGGRWGHELDERRIALPSGTHVIENRRGRTSHDRFPFLAAGTGGFGEELGRVWSVHLGWSGNHRTVAERLPDGSLLILTGELFEPGEMSLAPGEETVSPVAYAAFSGSGLAALSRSHHADVRRLLSWPGGRMSPRPVTLNTWEGTYFAHDEARLLRQAEAAARIGIERFVLDDGWMQGRHNDTAGLGDWVVDAGKYPQGLGRLASRVTELGMQFGLWVEPEMANPDSEALREHPDAALAIAGRRLRTSRHQVVLDLTDSATFERVHAALDRLLRELPISYLKWDMNRELVAAGNAAGRAVTRTQTLAVYALMDRLRSDHAALEIESCASGGGRADLGVLQRTQRIWASDCTDALDRIAIQRGFSRLLPPEVIGAHVSAVPNHQTGRRHTLAFRAAVALFCHFGIELDPLTLCTDEEAELRGWIVLHKRLRPLLHAGHHVALDSQDGRMVSGVVAPDASAGAWLVTQTASPVSATPAPLRLPGLLADARYVVTAPAPQSLVAYQPSATHRALFGTGIVLHGGILAETGFAPPPLVAESALILHAARQPHG